MVGFFDSISNIIYVSEFVRTFGILTAFAFHIHYPADHEPAIWFVVYVCIILAHVGFGKYSFLFMSIMGVIVLAFPIIFMLGTTDLQDFHENVTVPLRLVEPFPLGTRKFFVLLPLPELFYFGIDMLALVCEDTKDVGNCHCD